MSAGFTPGPWLIGNGGHPHGAEWEVRSADDADWYITGVPWGDDAYDTGIPRHAEAHANAHLIASAPDMVAALDHYADQLCEGWCEQSPDCAHFDDCGGCLARRVAWQARGEVA